MAGISDYGDEIRASDVHELRVRVDGHELVHEKVWEAIGAIRERQAVTATRLETMGTQLVKMEGSLERVERNLNSGFSEARQEMNGALHRMGLSVRGWMGFAVATLALVIAFAEYLTR